MKDTTIMLGEEIKKIYFCKYQRYFEGDMFASCLNPLCGPALCSYVKDTAICPFKEVLTTK